MCSKGQPSFCSNFDIFRVWYQLYGNITYLSLIRWLVDVPVRTPSRVALDHPWVVWLFSIICRKSHHSLFYRIIILFYEACFNSISVHRIIYLYLFIIFIETTTMHVRKNNKEQTIVNSRLCKLKPNREMIETNHWQA